MAFFFPVSQKDTFKSVRERDLITCSLIFSFLTLFKTHNTFFFIVFFSRADN